MDVSTEYSRRTLGLLSQLPWAPTPVPGQPQHGGVHLSTMKTLRTGLSGTPREIQARSDFIRALCKKLPGSEVKGLKDQNHRLVKL